MASSPPPPQPNPSISRKARRRSPWFWIILVVVALLPCSCIGGIFAYVLMSHALLAGGTASPFVWRANISLGNSPVSSPSDVATDFMQNLKDRSYLSAYRDLEITPLPPMTPDDFISQAKMADTCAGSVTAFHLTKDIEEPGSAQITYTVTRSRLSHGYSFSLTIQQGGPKGWTITSYGNDESLVPPGMAGCS